MFKGKGDLAIVNNSRGLLISDHASEVFIGLLRDRFGDIYNKYVPEEEYGCFAKCGTTFAIHLLRTFVDYCNLVAWSFFVLFIGLCRFFDFAVREI